MGKMNPFDGLYFSRHYAAVTFPVGTTDAPGLRQGQRGALHAVAAHFSVKETPAVVTMPTGSGKTVVLTLAPYLLRSRRVLIVTPSRLVRNQIAEEFKSLSRARATGAVPADLPPPSVHEVRHRIGTPEAWQELAGYSVIVGTPNCVSPIINGVARPPEDFFDAVLMDEAHHSPAVTWSEILSSFPNAKKLLVTATPFRRDRKEIRGAFIFEYPVRKAYEDGVFGKIEYVGVENVSLGENDRAIARTAADIVAKDRATGLDHFLMVRTDSKARAKELAEVYAAETALKLARVDSGLTLKHVSKTIEALKRKELDGIIAVDMLGEGFDFPNLKIAAVHSPHKSLAATLQFIGRFARTGAPRLGQAKFVAVLQEIRGAVHELYDEGAEWQEIVPMLTDEKVQEELEIRASLSSFRADTRYDVDEEAKDLSLYAVRPYSHVKIYAVDKDLDVTKDVEMPAGLEIKHREVSDDARTVIFITKEQVQPKWAPPGRFARVEYDLFIIHIERVSGLLFICTSRRREAVYRHFGREFAGDAHEILAVDVINRVLNGITKPEAFSVGMRSRIYTSSESYRIMAGPNPSKTIRPADGRMYHRGHAMFRGQEGGEQVTVGFSSASKVWANAYLQIPHLLKWCEHVAAKLTNPNGKASATNWDYLPMMRRISVLPAEPVIGIEWDVDVYLEPPILRIGRPDGTATDVSLLDCDLRLRDGGDTNTIPFTVSIEDQEWPFEYALDGRATIRTVGWDGASGPSVIREEEELLLADFLVTSWPTFFFSDFSSLVGADYLPMVTDGLVFPPDRIDAIDWAKHQVDIHAERNNPQKGMIAIHDYLRSQLGAEDHAVVVYDDGSGEVADFVAVDEKDDGVHFTFVHAKRTKGKNPGERVEDVYEVCGQTVKSLRWAMSPMVLVDRLLFRTRDQDSTRLVTGTRDDLKRIRGAVNEKPSTFSAVIVQPGVSRAALTANNIALPLAAADYFIGVGGLFRELRIAGSA